MLVFLGGMGEFGTSLLCILAFGKAEDFQINAGIAGVLLPLSSVVVSFASYCVYRERIALTGILGMLIIIIGATVIALFPAKSDSE